MNTEHHLKLYERRKLENNNQNSSQNRQFSIYDSKLKQQLPNSIQRVNFIEENNDRPNIKQNNQQNSVATSGQLIKTIESQQASFSNRQNITIFQDSNEESLSPVRKTNNNTNCQKYTMINKNIMQTNDQQKDKMKKKLTKISEFFHEIKFAQLSLDSSLKEQKFFITSQIQEIKSFIFKLNIKFQKQIMQQTKTLSAQTSRCKQINRNSTQICDLKQQNDDLKQYCKWLENEKTHQSEKYQISLQKYQEQIQLITNQLLKKSFALSNSNILQYKCEKCKFYQFELQKMTDTANKSEQYKRQLLNEQQKHKQIMKKFDQQIGILQNEFESIEKRKHKFQQNIKEKQKQLDYREVQLQYRLKDLQKRERNIQNSFEQIDKQKKQLQLQKQQITECQRKILRDQRKFKKYQSQKQIQLSQYYGNFNKQRITDNNQAQSERSGSRSSRSSRIQISSRLKQIQMMKNSGYKLHAQYSSKSQQSPYESRFTLSNNNLIPRNSITSNSKDFSKMRTNIRQSSRQSAEMIKLNSKLASLTQKIKKQLQQIN